MRPGEIFALHRADVHMDKRMIHVRWQLDLIQAISLGRRMTTAVGFR